MRFISFNCTSSMKKNAFILFFGLLSLCSFVHEYYVGIANLRVNYERKQIEMELKLDADDLEIVLKKQKPDFNLDKLSKEDKILLEKYINKHFSIWVNGQEKPLHLIGEELTNAGEFWTFWTVEIPDNITTIKIKNTILLPDYLQQQNIVNLKNHGKTLSHTFLYNHNTYIFNLNDAK